ncbi:MAG: hypothetical protein F6K65_28695 [Moorea sp. SIO3C2]|nr:hypothetical protein [Moorena sp. SIO3C2]
MATLRERPRYANNLLTFNFLTFNLGLLAFWPRYGNGHATRMATLREQPSTS